MLHMWPLSFTCLNWEWLAYRRNFISLQDMQAFHNGTLLRFIQLLLLTSSFCFVPKQNTYILSCLLSCISSCEFSCHCSRQESDIITSRKVKCYMFLSSIFFDIPIWMNEWGPTSIEHQIGRLPTASTIPYETANNPLWDILSAIFKTSACIWWFVFPKPPPSLWASFMSSSTRDYEAQIHLHYGQRPVPTKRLELINDFLESIRCSHSTFKSCSDSCLQPHLEARVDLAGSGPCDGCGAANGELW